MSKENALLMGRAILNETIATLRFRLCVCGNEQPYTVGRGVPECESCGRVLLKDRRRVRHKPK